MKTVFFGSSDFARPALRTLVEAGRAPALVVTKPDAPRGRGRKIYPADVKVEAEQLELDYRQPEDPNADDFIAELGQAKFDLGIVVSYGVVMSPALYETPAQGCINAHASLLPKYRGAAPIQRALADGCTETGITIMRIEKELDPPDAIRGNAYDLGDDDAEALPRDLREASQALAGSEVARDWLGDAFVDGFGDMTQTTRGSNTVLEGRYVDQSHLHGLLDRLRGLGIEILGFDTSPKEAHQ